MRRAPRHRSRSASAGWLLVAALGASSCGKDAAGPASEAAASSAPSRGGTLVAAVGSDIGGLNPLLSDQGQFNHDILSRLFLTLLEEQPDHTEHPPTFAPELAESFTWSDDHLTLTLELRQDARWSDGVPITAEDVRWTWQAQVSPEVTWAYAASKEGIRDVEVVGLHTVRVHFHDVTVHQLADLNEGFILPRHAWSAKPLGEWRRGADWFRDHLVTSGPFVLEGWRPGQEIALRRNPAYFDAGRPVLDRVVFRIVPEKVNQIAQLLAGQADFIDNVPAEHLPRLGADPAIAILEYWSSQYTYLGWNIANPLFREPEVRRALTLGIDREAMIEALLGGRAHISTSPIVSSVWAHDRELQPWPYDPTEARRLLATHGWQDRDGDGVLDREGRPFAFDLLTSAGSRLWVDATVVVQSQLARIGVAARPRQLELNTFNGKLAARDYEAALSSWTIDTSLDLTYAFHSRSIADGLNFGSYSNPEVDRLIDEARRQATWEAARPLLIEIQRILHRDQPYTFLWEPLRATAVRRRVRDAQPNALSAFFDLEEWWVEP